VGLSVLDTLLITCDGLSEAVRAKSWHVFNRVPCSSDHGRRANKSAEVDLLQRQARLGAVEGLDL